MNETYMSTPKESVTTADMTASIIHKTHATVVAHDPHAGTQTNIHISTKVANPIGMVPRNNEFVESLIMTPQISG